MIGQSKAIRGTGIGKGLASFLALSLLLPAWGLLSMSHAEDRLLPRYNQGGASGLAVNKPTALHPVRSYSANPASKSKTTAAPAVSAISNPMKPTLQEKMQEVITSSPQTVPARSYAATRSIPEPSVARDAGVAFQQLDDLPYPEEPSSNEPTKPSPLKGAITTLKVTKGRSQIIKFAQPITRISIAEPTLAELIPLSPDQIMINGKQRGITSLIVWDEFGQEGIFDLQVQNDTSELLDAVYAIAPNENIQARVTDDSFILTGAMSNSILLDEIRRLVSAYGYREANFIDLTETPSPQVVLEVKIAEASRNIIKDFKSSFTSPNGDLTLTRLGSLPVATPGVDNGGLQVNSVIPLVPGNSAIPFNNQNTNQVGGILASLTPSPRWHFRAALDALENKGKITILAEPSLVCTHGRTASFLAGGEFPFTSGTDQNGSPIISFKEFGVKLNFTPFIAIRSGRIELKVEPEVSQLDRSTCITGQGGQLVCGLLRRTTSTTVDLKNGETLMISGIIQRDEANTFLQVPFIGNVPILGALFKNANFIKNERELVVVITPRIINNTDYGKVLSKRG